MKKVLVLGDSHGNIKFMRLAFSQAQKRGCDAIVQVGDFGYWEHVSSGVVFLKQVENLAQVFEIPIYWLDGNHENHPMLWTKYPENDDGLVEIRKNVFYLPRGHSWLWEGIKFVSLGGAWSIDKAFRRKEEVMLGREQIYWWPTEELTDTQVEIACDLRDADVMFTHDCPIGVQVPGIQPIWEGDLNRSRVATVVKALKPRLLIHGHYHVQYSSHYDFSYNNLGKLDWHRVQIEGLAHDGYGDWRSWVVLDLEEWKKENWDRITHL